MKEDRYMDNQIQEPITIDGQVSVLVDEQFLWAKLVVTKPENGGREVTFDDVMAELEKNKVFANIDEEKIQDYLDNIPDDKKSIIVAEATPAEDGRDGQINYVFEPKSELKPSIDEETGIVNFKELGKVKNIKKGKLIATIKKNTDGKPGMDVRGFEIKPNPGKPAKYFVGPGTIQDNEQTRIYAANDGNIRWDKDRFIVDTIVTISGDIDASVGNIDFVGDVVIKGGVQEGYRVRGKNVTIKQNVTNATVEAAESITISSGAVYSKLSCEGTITMQFAENCNIFCKGNLQSKSMINCNVLCESEVIVTGGKGVIVGGECIAYKNITANQIGSESYTKTTINLGNTATLMKSHKELSDNFKTLNENYKRLKALYEKLNELKDEQTLTPQQEAARKQAFLFVMNERNTMADMSERIEKNERILAKSRLLQLIVKKRCYPGVYLKLYNSVYENNVENGAVVFYLDSNNEIRFRAGN